MDFGKLSANVKMAVYAAIVVILAGIISNWGGLVWLSVLVAALVVAVAFLPQVSPSTSLPGSPGSLLLVLGIVAAGGMAIELLRWLDYFFGSLDDYRTWLFTVALVASLVMAWAAWQEFQAEGGTFSLGAASRPTTAAAPGPATDASPAEPAAPGTAAEPGADEERAF